MNLFGNHEDKEELDHNIDKELFYKVLDTQLSHIKPNSFLA